MQAREKLTVAEVEDHCQRGMRSYFETFNAILKKKNEGRTPRTSRSCSTTAARRSTAVTKARRHRPPGRCSQRARHPPAVRSELPHSARACLPSVPRGEPHSPATRCGRLRSARFSRPARLAPRRAPGGTCCAALPPSPPTVAVLLRPGRASRRCRRASCSISKERSSAVLLAAFVFGYDIAACAAAPSASSRPRIFQSPWRSATLGGLSA